MKIWHGIAILVALVLANVLVQHAVVRWDMTDDHRYSIAASTKELMQELEAPAQVTILLDGELNAGFQRLQRATMEMVEELSIYAEHHMSVVVSAENVPQGIEPTVIHERTHKGQTAQTTVYPFALVTYQGKTAVVELLRNQRGLSGEENLNHSIENLEFAFVEAIHLLTRDTVEKIAFLEGHGELSERDVYDLSQALSYYYQVDRGVLGTETGVLDDYRAVIIADPQLPFSESDKYILDQYLMQGGRILWVVNGVRFSDQQLSTNGMTPIIPLDLKLNDMLFCYGVRVNPALVQDLQCLPMPVDVSNDPQQPNWQPMPWTYAPLLLTSQASPITRNVAQVTATMASCIDLVGGDDGLQKEVLLATSSASRVTGTPAEVDLSLFDGNEEAFKYSYIPVAASLSGEFSSLYAHLLPPEEVTLNAPLRKKSVATKQIVVAAGSTIRNEWQQGQPLPLGYDRYTRMQFGNRDFMVNAVLYLTDDTGWMSLRQKELTLRLLNDQRAREQRITAQIICILVPLMILAIVGGVIIVVRKHRYTKKIMNRIFVHIWLLIVLATMPIHMSGQQPLAYPLDTIDGKIYYRYTVERSIGLYRLSVNFGVSQEEILRANPQIQKQGLRYDEVILIPAKGLEVQPAAETSPASEGIQTIVEAVAQPKSEPTPQPKLEGEKKRRRITLPQLKWQNRDTVPAMDTVAQMVDTVPTSTFVDSTAIRLALMLPLHADAIKRDKNMDRFYDFYAGALIAIYETQAEGQSLEVFTYDVGKSIDEVEKVMSQLSANKVDAIIGPAYSQQVALAIDSASKDSTWILVPFLPRVNNIEQSPFAIKFNPSPQIEADALAKYLAERKDSVQCVLLEAKEGEVIPHGIAALHQSLKQYKVPTSTITLRAILTDSLDGLHPEKENILIFNTEKYNNLNTVIPHLLAAYSKYRITLFSHYSWQSEKIILPQLYTSVFAKECLVPDNYDELYRTYFNHELSSLQPRYDLLGYDLTKHLLHMLMHGQQDTNANMREVIANYPWAGTQANIHYQPIGEQGGFENNNVYIIHQ